MLLYTTMPMVRLTFRDLFFVEILIRYLTKYWLVPNIIRMTTIEILTANLTINAVNVEQAA